MNNVKENAYRIIKSVASPLRFFAISIIVLGLIIVGLAWKSTLPPNTTETLILVAFAVLIILIFSVFFLVMFSPKKLVFDQEAHLAVMRERLGDSELQRLYDAGSLPKVSAGKALPREIDGP